MHFLANVDTRRLTHDDHLEIEEDASVSPRPSDRHAIIRATGSGRAPVPQDPDFQVSRLPRLPLWGIRRRRPSTAWPGEPDMTTLNGEFTS
jgi:hypothetical protein